MLHAVDRFGQAQAVAVVGVGGGQVFVCVCGAGQPSAVCPGKVVYAKLERQMEGKRNSLHLFPHKKAKM